MINNIAFVFAQIVGYYTFHSLRGTRVVMGKIFYLPITYEESPKDIVIIHKKFTISHCFYMMACLMQHQRSYACLAYILNNATKIIFIQ